MAVVNQEHLVCWALNKKNAVRKFRRQIGLPDNLLETVEHMQTRVDHPMLNKN
jgi:hypothetical protein